MCCVASFSHYLSLHNSHSRLYMRTTACPGSCVLHHAHQPKHMPCQPNTDVVTSQLSDQWCLIDWQGGSGSHHFPFFTRFWNDKDRTDLVVCGTAAGVAAAFRSPLGGVLFALEEMSTWWRSELLWLAFFTTAVVSGRGVCWVKVLWQVGVWDEVFVGL